MNYNLLEQRLIETIVHRCKALGIIWVIVLILLIYNVLVGHIKSSNDGVSIWSIFTNNTLFRNKLSLKQQIVSKIICLVLIPVLLIALFLVPAYNDLSNQQFIQVCCEYSRKEATFNGNLFSNGRVLIKTEGEEFSLDLPFGYNTVEFPVGTYYGMIWYSRDTRIILSFEIIARTTQDGGRFSVLS